MHHPSDAALAERTADIVTRDGAMTTWIAHPVGDGACPVVLLFMDAPGIREELRRMGRRLANAGHYVMLPNLYYRAQREEMGVFRGDERGDRLARIKQLMDSIGIDQVMDDTAALLAYARADAASSNGPVGCLGYCMSGQFALSAAARFPADVAAAASIYGTHLVTDRPDSPHLSARHARGELYIAWAGIDPFAAPELMAPLRASLQDAGVRAEIDFYEGVWHGFAFPERNVYDAAAAERCWRKLLDLFARTLR
jgi:carboxymethylenebutenolidase